MSNRVGMVIVAGACLSLAGCDALRWGDDTAEDRAPDVNLADAETGTDPAPVPEDTPASDAGDDTVRPASVTSTADIDWEAARRDLAGNSETDTTFNIQSGSSAPPVPVLLPSGPVRTASAAGGQQPQFRPLDDGYFAVFPGAQYNLIVNGTNQVTDVPELENAGTGDMKYVETTTGAIVTFSRYGADYMVEFECLGSGEEGGSCVTEEEALSVAEEIVISGTQ